MNEIQQKAQQLKVLGNFDIPIERQKNEVRSLQKKEISPTCGNSVEIRIFFGCMLNFV